MQGISKPESVVCFILWSNQTKWKETESHFLQKMLSSIYFA